MNILKAVKNMVSGASAQELQRFVILFSPRSGSSWLRSALDSNPGYSLGFELLADVETAEDQAAAVDAFFSRDLSDEGVRALGFKLGGYQIKDAKTIKPVLDKHNVQVIHVYRDNLLKVAVSQVRRAQLSEATEKTLGKRLQNLVDGVEAPPPSKIDPKTLVARMQDAETTRQEADALADFFDRPQINVSYEAMLSDLDAVIDQISEFLGVPAPTRDEYRPRKNTPDDLSEAVTNLDEIVAALRETKYAHYVEGMS